MTDEALRLLETDLDRLVDGIPKIITYTCDAHQNPRCLVRDRTLVARSCGAQPTNEISVVNRDELRRLARDLVEFRRKWKETHGCF